MASDSAIHKSYNELISEASLLLKEVTELRRYKKEVESIQKLQDRLTPEVAFARKDLVIKGLFLPCTECSGDWWLIAERGSDVFLWLGDVTGHGAAQALFASTARSLLEFMVADLNLNLQEMGAHLNRCLYRSFRGEILTTLVGMQFREGQSRVQMINQAHEDLLVVDSAQPEVDIHVVSALGAEPLGLTESIQLNPREFEWGAHQTLLVYTDGMREVLYTHGLRASPRSLRALKKSLPTSASVSSLHRHFSDMANLITDTIDSDDDMAMLVVGRP